MKQTLDDIYVTSGIEKLNLNNSGNLGCCLVSWWEQLNLDIQLLLNKFVFFFQNLNFIKGDKK